MLRGIYTGASGLLAESIRMEMIANNLANATTTGFKKSALATDEFSVFLVRNMAMPGQPEIGSTGLGSQVSRLGVVAAQGPLKNTGNPLDIALVGGGWLSVQTQAGVRYTRDGSFSLDQAGTLVTKNGDAVLGEDGPIRLDRGSPVGIAQDGTVTQDGRVVGRLRLVSLDVESLAKEGDNLVNGTPGGQMTARVRQGFLEGSTVNVVSEMVELIAVMRSFEANQKAVQSQDETLGQAITRVGVV